MKRHLRLIVLTLGLASILFITKSYFLNIQKVEVISNLECVSADELTSQLNLQGQIYWLLDQKKETDQILSKHPCIKSLVFEYSYPSTVKVKTEPRVGFLKLASFEHQDLELSQIESTPSSMVNWTSPGASGSGDLVVDSEGVIFRLDPLADLITLFVANQEVKIGYHFRSDLFSLIPRVIEKFGSLGLNFNQMKLVDDDLFFPTQPNIAISLGSDLDRNLGSLQLILQEAKMSNVQIQSVDLRFTKPVVVYVSKK